MLCCQTSNPSAGNGGAGGSYPHLPTAGTGGAGGGGMDTAQSAKGGIGGGGGGTGLNGEMMSGGPGSMLAPGGRGGSGGTDGSDKGTGTCKAMRSLDGWHFCLVMRGPNGACCVSLGVSHRGAA